jgi:ethanolamine permease
VGAIVCMATMIYYNPLIFGLFAIFLACGYGFFLTTKAKRLERAAA